jgi:hypothetical protein
VFVTANILATRRQTQGHYLELRSGRCMRRCLRMCQNVCVENGIDVASRGFIHQLQRRCFTSSIARDFDLIIISEVISSSGTHSHTHSHTHTRTLGLSLSLSASVCLCLIALLRRCVVGKAGKVVEVSRSRVVLCMWHASACMHGWHMAFSFETSAVDPFTCRPVGLSACRLVGCRSQTH